MNFSERGLVVLVVLSLTLGSVARPAQAALISTEDVAQALTVPAAWNRERLVAALARPEVQQQLVQRGVDPAQARERVAALTDEEVASLVQRIDRVPAGGVTTRELAVIILLLLLLLFVADGGSIEFDAPDFTRLG